MQIFDKLANNEPLSIAEMSELKRFGRDIQTVNVQTDLLRSVLSDIDILYSSDTDLNYNFTVPEHYRHLLVVTQARSTASLPANSTWGYGFRFNGDSGSNYTYKYVQSSDYTGSSPYSSSELSTTYLSLGNIPPSSAPSNTTGVAIAFVPNVLGSNYKTSVVLTYVVIEKEVLYIQVSKWNNTAFVKNINVATSNLASGSFISVYGLR